MLKHGANTVIGTVATGALGLAGYALLKRNPAAPQKVMATASPFKKPSNAERAAKATATGLYAARDIAKGTAAGAREGFRHASVEGGIVGAAMGGAGAASKALGKTAYGKALFRELRK